MKKRRDGMAKKFAEEMQLPQSAVTDIFKIELRGQTDLTVEGCKGIVEYDEKAISLNLGKIVLHIVGLELEISTFSEQQVVITGTVSSIEFSQ